MGGEAGTSSSEVSGCLGREQKHTAPETSEVPHTLRPCVSKNTTATPVITERLWCEQAVGCWVLTDRSQHDTVSTPRTLKGLLYSLVTFLN